MREREGEDKHGQRRKKEKRKTLLLSPPRSCSSSSPATPPPREPPSPSPRRLPGPGARAGARQQRPRGRLPSVAVAAAKEAFSCASFSSSLGQHRGSSFLFRVRFLLRRRPALRDSEARQRKRPCLRLPRRGSRSLARGCCRRRRWERARETSSIVQVYLLDENERKTKNKAVEEMLCFDVKVPPPQIHSCFLRERVSVLRSSSLNVRLPFSQFPFLRVLRRSHR